MITGTSFGVKDSSSNHNTISSYKLQPPTDHHINPLVNNNIREKNKRIKTSTDYPDFFPWIHTNPKINKIYLDNLINGYTTGDLLSKNPLNDDRKLYITTNSNSNGNNTSTTSLGENESGYKLFKLGNHNSTFEEQRNMGLNEHVAPGLGEDIVDLDSLLDKIEFSFKTIKHIRAYKVNIDEISPTPNQLSQTEFDDPVVFVGAIKSIIKNSHKTEIFVSEMICKQISLFNCQNWAPYMITVLSDMILSSDPTPVFNSKFRVYWRLYSIMFYDLNVLNVEQFYFEWLIPFISNMNSLSENGNQVNEKLPIVRFITFEVVLKLFPKRTVTLLNDLLKQLITLIIPKENKFNNIVNENLLNPLLAEIFNSKNISCFKMLNSSKKNSSAEESVNSGLNLEVKYTEWLGIYDYLKSIEAVDLEKLEEVQMWNESIALKYLHILPSLPADDTIHSFTDQGIKLNDNSMIILTQEYDPKNILSHFVLKIISSEKLINTFSFYNEIQQFSLHEKFEEDKFWSILITIVLKTKLDFNMLSLNILTNYLIDAKKVNLNNFFLKLISSGVLHNSYIEKFGTFLINLNVLNNAKQYDSILSKYFKHLFDDYNSAALNKSILSENTNNKTEPLSVLINKSNIFLNELLSKDFVDYDSIHYAETVFIKEFKGQYYSFWFYLNSALESAKIFTFKAFKLILDYIITYTPDRDILDFKLLFDYYMKLEQSMILKDLQFSETQSLKLQYQFDVSMINTDVISIMTTDNNIYDFKKSWKLLESLYETDIAIFEQLISYENGKNNNILTYNFLKANLPHNIQHLKDEVSNHGILQQFLTKTFREYFHNKNDITFLTNIKLIKFMFSKTFNNYIPYFIKRLKLDSHSNDSSFFQKMLFLITDDILNIDILFNRLPFNDVICFMNYLVSFDNKYPLTKYQLYSWILKDDETIIKILSRETANNSLKCVLVNRFIQDKSNVISKWLMNEKALICQLLNINYNEWFLKLNEENIFTELIYKLNFTNFRYMKLLLNEFINNLNIDEIVKIIENLNGDFIIGNFLVIDFNTIEDFGNHLLNELLNKALDFQDEELLIYLINNNIKLNDNCLQNFVISQVNLKKIITKLSAIKQNNDQMLLTKIFKLMLIYSIKDIKLNIKTNHGNKHSNTNANAMSLRNRILASLVNDRLSFDNDNENSYDPLKTYKNDSSTDVVKPKEVIYYRSNR